MFVEKANHMIERQCFVGSVSECDLEGAKKSEEEAKKDREHKIMIRK
jgi:hypothetical protein